MQSCDTGFRCSIEAGSPLTSERDIPQSFHKELMEKHSTFESGFAAAERYRLLVDAVEEYTIFMLDPDGFVVSWNSGAQRLKGYTEREILGRHFSAFYSPDDVREVDYRSARGVDKSMLSALANCGWVRRQQNVIIIGATGVGKT